MAIEDFLTGAYNKLIALWVGDTAWALAVLPGNRLWATGKAQSDPRKTSKSGDSDYPQAMLELGSFSYQADPKSETFATFAPDFTPATGEAQIYWAQNFVLTLTTKTLRIGEVDPLLVRTAAALHKGYPDLGLSYVFSMGKVTSTLKDSNRDEAKGTLRKVMTLTIPITFLIDGRDLVAA